MSSRELLREKFLTKLWELFRLDQPEFDFGFYRIMHVKDREVKKFVEHDLSRLLSEELEEIHERERLALEKSLREEIETAKEYGSADPNAVPKVKELRSQLQSKVDRKIVETEVYEHLYRFFERYFDHGDFLSRRYYTRETADRASPFAIPYNGEEIKLHWANADQYYIKNSEYFSNFVVDLKQAKELREHGEGITGIEGEETPLRVHFRVVQATEGEHGDIKEQTDQKRYFSLQHDKPFELTSEFELCINFKYQPDFNVSGIVRNWQSKRNRESVAALLKRMSELVQSDNQNSRRIAEYLSLLVTPLSKDPSEERILLDKYIENFTGRNSVDYFIHKDLGTFLRREIDFYIKNEVFLLDSLEQSDTSHFEQCRVKAKLIRKLASTIIEFLAQLEDFQKKLWLKKKFVLDTHYCVSIDQVPVELYPEIIKNEDQIDEWIRNFAIDEIELSLESPKFTRPLTLEFLKCHDKLVLDTRWFSDKFKEDLVASFDNVDEICEGLLIHSENFQALNLLRNRFLHTIQSIYIDPPYNTAASEILYKNSYKHSSWLSLLASRLELSRQLMKPSASMCIAINEVEGFSLQLLLNEIFGLENYVSTLAIQHNPGGRSDAKHISPSHEYLHIYANHYPSLSTNQLTQTSDELTKKFPKKDQISAYREQPFRRGGSNSRKSDRPNMFYPIYYSEVRDQLALFALDDTFVPILPINLKGEERIWRWGKEKALSLFETDFLVKKQNNGFVIYVKDRQKDSIKPKSFWHGSKHDASSHGTKRLQNLFDQYEFSYPKSFHTVSDIVKIFSSDTDTILDFFGGSGTTGAVVVDLNRKLQCSFRRYILVEMGQYFENVMIPRLAKESYSADWRAGKPTNRTSGISHCFKYLKLESYEDTLNNLEFDTGEIRRKVLEANPSLNRDYMLRYWLDVELEGSQSLLNIEKFKDPSSYTLKVKQPGKYETITKKVDLLETFNFLIGLRIRHISMSRYFSATFITSRDRELPENQTSKLEVEKLQEDRNGQWWFRTVEGWIPKNRMTPNDGEIESVLIIWRNLTDCIEKDNLVLNTWFEENYEEEFDFGVVYVNGTSNLMTLKKSGERWQVHLLEDEFLRCMWDTSEH